MVAEIAKQQVNNGGRAQVYYFRDQQGLEADLIVPQGPDRLALIEAKASKTPVPSMGQSLRRLAESIQRYETQSIVVHGATARDQAGTTLLPGVTALSLTQLLEQLQ